MGAQSGQKTNRKRGVIARVERRGGGNHDPGMLIKEVEGGSVAGLKNSGRERERENI